MENNEEGRRGTELGSLASLVKAKAQLRRGSNDPGSAYDGKGPSPAAIAGIHLLLPHPTVIATARSFSSSAKSDKSDQRSAPGAVDPHIDHAVINRGISASDISRARLADFKWEERQVERQQKWSDTVEIKKHQHVQHHRASVPAQDQRRRSSVFLNAMNRMLGKTVNINDALTTIAPLSSAPAEEIVLLNEKPVALRSGRRGSTSGSSSSSAIPLSGRGRSSTSLPITLPEQVSGRRGSTPITLPEQFSGRRGSTSTALSSARRPSVSVLSTITERRSSTTSLSPAAITARQPGGLVDKTITPRKPGGLIDKGFDMSIAIPEVESGEDENEKEETESEGDETPDEEEEVEDSEFADSEHKRQEQQEKDAYVLPIGESYPAVCEECEQEGATLRCDACAVTVCPRCCMIIHPNHTTNVPHNHLVEGRVRPFRPGDPSGCLPLERMEISDWPMDEEEWLAVINRNSSTLKSIAIESISINELCSKGSGRKKVSPTQFYKNDLVVFDCKPGDECAPPSSSSADDDGQQQQQQWPFAPSCHPPWRDPQASGTILSTTTSQPGRSVTASRRGQDHEVWYMIDVNGYVSGDFAGLCRQQVEREAKRKRPLYYVKSLKPPKALNLVSLAKEEAYERDRRIKQQQEEVEKQSLHRVHEAQHKYVVLLPESALKWPGKLQHDYLEAKLKALKGLLWALHDRFLEQVVRHRYHQWRAYHGVYRDKALGIPASRIQAWVRRCLQRHTLEKKRRAFQLELYLYEREAHKEFHYVEEAGRKTLGGKMVYTVNNKDYFHTVNDVRKWMRARQKAAKRVLWFMKRKARDDLNHGIEQWKKWLVAQQPAHIDVDPLDTLPGVILSRDDLSFHPAMGLSALPLLPKIGARRNKVGIIRVTDHKRWQEYRENYVGPGTVTSWIIKDLVLMGGPPFFALHESPLVDKTKTIPIPPSTLAAAAGSGSASSSLYTSKPLTELIMSAGPTTFVCLCEKEEIQSIEREYQIPSLERECKSQHKKCRINVNNEVSRLENNLTIEQGNLDTVLSVKRKPPRKSMMDQMIRVRAAQQDLDKAMAISRRTGSEFTWLHHPIKKEAAGALKGLVDMVLDLEERLRKGEKLYVWSGDGHGRAAMVCGCLLGRIYGLPIEETIERLQFADYCRRGENDRDWSVPSCPQTILQAHHIRQVVSMRESEYESIVTLSGPPIDVARCKLIRARKRRVGYPVLEAKGTVIVDDVS